MKPMLLCVLLVVTTLALGRLLRRWQEATHDSLETLLAWPTPAARGLQDREIPS